MRQGLSISREPHQEKALRYHNIRYFVLFFNCLEFLFFLFLWYAWGLSHRLDTLASGFSYNISALQTVITVVGFHICLYLVQIPQLFYVSFALERQFGLSDESFRQWLLDEFKSNLIGLFFLVILVVIFYEVFRLQPDHWWLTFALIWIGFTLLLTRILPTWIIPLFYPMKHLSDGQLKKRLMNLAKRMNVDHQDIYEIALSRKTRKANAAVLGLGKGRRIVLGDTLLNKFSDDEIEVVLSHELAHHVKHHIPKFIFFNGFLAVVSFYLFYITAGILSSIFETFTIGDILWYPTVVLLMGIFNMFLLPWRNAFSRYLEAEADQEALVQTGSSVAFVSAMKKLAFQNLAVVSPSRWIEFIFYSHPSISRRIRYAQGF